MSSSINGGNGSEASQPAPDPGAHTASPQPSQSTAPSASGNIHVTPAETEAAMQVMIRRNGELASKVESLSSEKETYAARRDALAKQNATLHSAFEALQAEARRLQQEQIANSNVRMAGDKASAERTLLDFEGKSQELERLKVKYNDLEKEIREVKAALARSQEAEGHAREAVARLERERSEAQVAHERMMRRIPILEEENRHVGSLLQAAEADLSVIAGLIARRTSATSATAGLLERRPNSTSRGLDSPQATGSGPFIVPSGAPTAGLVPDKGDTSSHGEAADATASQAPCGGKRLRTGSTSPKSNPSAAKRARRARDTTSVQGPTATSPGPSKGKKDRTAGKAKAAGVSPSTRRTAHVSQEG
ncbi:hypothetical protein K523DRAFT_343698 [Schizophyllum commune Tattone D]|nr:hypothetical protein K523DRAFT_343698 [Schizophyllum commune Tattone D]